MGKRKKRPLQWLSEATPAEIGEALLAVDRVKAAQVVAYLASRLGPELERIGENMRTSLEHDPLGAIGRALIGLSGSQR
jgi:hypothetical protein